MKFDSKRAVSPIIATLLLIAIAVAAGIIVYVYVNSLAGGLTSSGGNQVSEEIQLQAYSFTSVSGTGPSSTNWVIDASLENVGSSSVTISNIYVDGTALTEWYCGTSPCPGLGTGTYDRYLQMDTSGGSCFAAIPSGVSLVGATGSLGTSGNGSACGMVGASQNCTTHICIDTGGSTQAETLTLSAQSSNEIVIGLNAAATSGTSHTIKIVTADGGQSVFTVVAGRTG